MDALIQMIRNDYEQGMMKGWSEMIIREMDQGTYTDAMWRGEEAGRAGVAKLLAEPSEHSAKPAKPAKH